MADKKRNVYKRMGSFIYFQVHVRICISKLTHFRATKISNDGLLWFECDMKTGFLQ